MTDTITLPREVVERLVATWDWDAETLIGHRMKIMSELVDNLRTALAAEQPKHPGYIIGSHWLETAYSRICAGESEARVLRDYGSVSVGEAEALQRENEALRRENERLREALKLAFASHGRMLMSDPPQDAWKFNRVDEVIVAALRREET